MRLAKNEAGFMLYEQLITISILLCTLPLLMMILQVIKHPTTLDDVAVEHFFLFMRNDLWYSESFIVRDNQVHITMDNGETAIIEQAGDRIRRRLKGGIEFYLFDIKEMEVNSLAYGLQIRITTNKNNQYEKIIPQFTQ